LRDRIAALVACLAADRQRSGQPLASVRQIAGLEGDLAEQPLALAFDFLVLDLASEREARFEVELGARIVVDVHLDLPEVQQARSPRPNRSDNERKISSASDSLFARAGPIADRQPRQRQCRQGRSDVDRVAEAAPQREAGLQHLLRFAVVALAFRERRADVECVRLRKIRCLDLGHRQRRPHHRTALGRVAAQGSRSPASRRRNLTAMNGSTPPDNDCAIALRRLSSSVSTRWIHSACCDPFRPRFASFAIAK
jgi:hypothetical protein